jgi:hypothetical protein
LLHGDSGADKFSAEGSFDGGNSFANRLNDPSRHLGDFGIDFRPYGSGCDIYRFAGVIFASSLSTIGAPPTVPSIALSDTVSLFSLGLKLKFSVSVLPWNSAASFPLPSPAALTVLVLISVRSSFEDFHSRREPSEIGLPWAVFPSP